MNFETLSRLYRETLVGPQRAKNHFLLQYSLLIDNSPLGPTCPYAAKALRLHWETQHDEVLIHLRALRANIDTLVENLESLEDPTVPPTGDHQLEFPFVV